MQGVVFVVLVASMVAVALGHDNWDSNSMDNDQFGCCKCSVPARGRRPATPNPCANNTGTNNICGSKTGYLSCSGTVCSNATCPAQQLWNQTAKACVSCNAGFHVAANYPRCVCNIGTTYNHTSRVCMPCPTDSTQLDDKCFCNSTGATPYLSWSAWACKSCPGEYVSYNVTVGDWFESEIIEITVCQCPAATDIFNRVSVSCVTCPAGSTTVKSRNPDFPDYCQCSAIRGQYYDEKTNTCSCPRNHAPNAANTRCVYVAPTTTVKSA